MRKRFSAQQKTQMVLELLKEEKTLAQIAAEYGADPDELRRWKSQVLEGLPGLFDKREKAEREQQAVQDQIIETLDGEIDRLTIQKTWLERKSGIIKDELLPPESPAEE